MKTKYKLLIGFLALFIFIIIALYLLNQAGTGRATATVEFSIQSNVSTPPAPAPTVEPGSSGGGGGGGITKCVENWLCGDWDLCPQSEYQTRSCSDLRKCRTIKNKPSEIQRCNYLTRPSNCFDNIQNRNEEGIDCGGNCVQCPNCFDGIKNQNEADVDCSGQCKECISEADVKDKAAFGVVFGIGNLLKEINLFWPVWLLLSLLLLIFMQLYHDIKENIRKHQHYRYHSR